ncbi:MAG: ATP-binding protein [Fibrobacterota bacterium]
MNESIPDNIRLQFPSDLEYIPAIRKFISEVLQIDGFSSKFAYRSEIIIDEICNNAVVYGCKSLNDIVDLSCTIFKDRIEVNVKDQGGAKSNIERLRQALKREKSDIQDISEEYSGRGTSGLGFEIIRTLSEEVEFEIDENNLTSIKVVRRREQDSAEDKQF